MGVCRTHAKSETRGTILCKPTLCVKRYRSFDAWILTVRVSIVSAKNCTIPCPLLCFPSFSDTTHVCVNWFVEVFAIILYCSPINRDLRSWSFLTHGNFICYKILQLNCWNSYGYVFKRFSRCIRVNGASLITDTFV